jgi:hypothetical protein
MTEHTPLPWAFSPWHIEEGPSAVRAPAGHLVTTTASDADAAYIVKACNAFPDLVMALEQIAAIENKEFGPDWEEIEEARKIANDVLGRVKSPGVSDHG